MMNELKEKLNRKALNLVCRTCLLNYTDLTSIFTIIVINNDSKSLAEMIELCTSVAVSI